MNLLKESAQKGLSQRMRFGGKGQAYKHPGCPTFYSKGFAVFSSGILDPGSMAAHAYTLLWLNMGHDVDLADLHCVNVLGEDRWLTLACRLEGRTTCALRW